jgi:hypothetical protein
MNQSLSEATPVIPSQHLAGMWAAILNVESRRPMRCNETSLPPVSATNSPCLLVMCHPQPSMGPAAMYPMGLCIRAEGISQCSVNVGCFQKAKVWTEKWPRNGGLPLISVRARVWKEFACENWKTIQPEPISAQTRGKITVQIDISIAKFIDKNEIKAFLFYEFVVNYQKRNWGIYAPQLVTFWIW